MKFNCKTCNYSTDIKFCFEKHLKTNRHQEKVEEELIASQQRTKPIANNSGEFICHYCSMTFNKSCNLARHVTSCSQKEVLVNNYEKEILHLKEINNNTIQALEKEISHLRELNEQINNKEIEVIKNKDETIAILKSEVESLKSIVNNTGSVVKSSMTTMSYALKNFTNAPALEPIQNMASLHFEQSTDDFCETLIREYRHKALIIYIGDIIVKAYKKTDQSTQSLWNSDTSRLTYIIRKIIADNGDWVIDKKGVKTKKCVVEPVLDYVHKCLTEFIGFDKRKYRKMSADAATEKAAKITDAAKINELIDDKTLIEDVLKYITPHFCLSKNEDLLE